MLKIAYFESGQPNDKVIEQSGLKIDRILYAMYKELI